jgi:MSHA biogenesis protein MshN
MSVVNKMLRDLENRQHQAHVNANYIPPQKANKRWWSFGVCACLVLMASLYSVLANRVDIGQPVKQQAPATFIHEKGDVLASALLIEQASEQSLAVNAQTTAIELVSVPDTTEPLLNQQTHSEPDSTAKSAGQASANSPFKVRTSDGAKSELSGLRALAHLASEQGDDARVISLLHQILAIDATEIKTRKQLAALLFSKSMFIDAQTLLTAGLRQTPADSSLRLMLSRIHFKAGNNVDAFNVLVQHPYNQLANDELLSFRAALAEKIGEYEIAQQDYQLLVTRNPLEAKWWLGLGVAQDKQRLSEKAIGSYQQAQQLNQLPAPVETFVQERIQLLARRS